MKTLKQFMMAAAIGTLSAAGLVNAAASDYPSSATPLYREHEFSIDAFGSGSIGQETIDHLSGNRIEHNGRLGAGGGVNLFLTRYVGIGGDAYSENTAHRFIDSTSGSLILRLPLGETGIAPYIFGGGGWQFDEVSQRFAQAGGGLEFRFMPHAGFFVDARYVFADKTDNYGLGRAGLRISF